MADSKLIVNEHADLPKISKIADEIIFQPSPLQQTLKAQFWARASSNPFIDKTNLTLADVQEHVPDPKLKKYWSVPGFKEWFSNQDENRERLDYLWMVGLDAAEMILRDPAAQASAKVNLIKTLAEIQGLVSRGKNKEEKFSDETVNKMSEAELKEWLKKKGVSVQAEYKVRPNLDEEKF